MINCINHLLKTTLKLLKNYFKNYFSCDMDFIWCLREQYTKCSNRLQRTWILPQCVLSWRGNFSSGMINCSFLIVKNGDSFTHYCFWPVCLLLLLRKTSRSFGEIGGAPDTFVSGVKLEFSWLFRIYSFVLLQWFSNSVEAMRMVDLITKALCPIY